MRQSQGVLLLMVFGVLGIVSLGNAALPKSSTSPSSAPGAKSLTTQKDPVEPKRQECEKIEEKADSICKQAAEAAKKDSKVKLPEQCDASGLKKEEKLTVKTRGGQPTCDQEKNITKETKDPECSNEKGVTISDDPNTCKDGTSEFAQIPGLTRERAEKAGIKCFSERQEKGVTLVTICNDKKDQERLRSITEQAANGTGSTLKERQQARLSASETPKESAQPPSENPGRKVLEEKNGAPNYSGASPKTQLPNANDQGAQKTSTTQPTQSSSSTASSQPQSSSSTPSPPSPTPQPPSQSVPQISPQPSSQSSSRPTYTASPTVVSNPSPQSSAPARVVADSYTPSARSTPAASSTYQPQTQSQSYTQPSYQSRPSYQQQSSFSSLFSSLTPTPAYTPPAQQQTIVQQYPVYSQAPSQSTSVLTYAPSTSASKSGVSGAVKTASLDFDKELSDLQKLLASDTSATKSTSIVHVEKKQIQSEVSPETKDQQYLRQLSESLSLEDLVKAEQKKLLAMQKEERAGIESLSRASTYEQYETPAPIRAPSIPTKPLVTAEVPLTPVETLARTKETLDMQRRIFTESSSISPARRVQLSVELVEASTRAESAAARAVDAESNVAFRQAAAQLQRAAYIVAGEGSSADTLTALRTAETLLSKVPDQDKKPTVTSLSQLPLNVYKWSSEHFSWYKAYIGGLIGTSKHDAAKKEYESALRILATAESARTVTTKFWDPQKDLDDAKKKVALGLALEKKPAPLPADSVPVQPPQKEGSVWGSFLNLFGF